MSPLAEGLEPACEGVGRHEVREMGAELVVAIVMEAFDRRVLDRAVHPLDLAIGPRGGRPRKPVLDPVGLADHVEAHLPGTGGVTVARLFGELDAVVGQDRMDAVGDGLRQMLQELPSGAPVGPTSHLGDGEFAGSVDGTKRESLSSAVRASAMSMGKKPPLGRLPGNRLPGSGWGSA